ncbi:unnamed protein product [Spirodela intermedia]|uniref:Uncharacterized protein n=1 Tax=Spirodela intermedia TaxID=51605 RepID=A0A7I8ILZ5_SPIIN|nr:unnamed protein product [Spirodela intermedia]CAA6658897.1 unnamed protein product [Spirodela intermedia]
MNSAPDAIVHYVLSRMSNARDLASCTCVSRRWKETVPYDLVIYCPFSAAVLSSWISLKAPSLRRLELRVDSLVEKGGGSAVASSGRLDCISSARGLESLKLWGIVGAAFRDLALSETIQACPNLTHLALLGCDGVGSLSIDLQLLEKCRLDFLGPRSRTSLSAPPSFMLWRSRVSAGKVEMVEMEKLPVLQFLSLRGVQWSWNAVSSVLHCASEVRHLVMKIEFSGDFDRLQPFPPVDLVQFFNAHQKLRVFEIHGAMFAALCQKDSLQSLDSRFGIPWLEEVVITVRSPLNAEQKLSTLESLVKHSPRLRRMIIRISQMKNCNEMADDFFEDICRFRGMNSKKVYIE